MQHWALRLCVVALVGLSSGAALAAPLEGGRSQVAARAAPQGAKTAAIKTAIKVVVKVLRKAAAADAVALLTKEGATTATARVAVRNAATIATRLESLLVWEELTLEIIKDNVVNALTRAGVADIVARDVGHYVKLAVHALL